MEGMTRDQQEKMMTMQQWHMIQGNIKEQHMISLRCFSDCVVTFRSKDLERKEITCINNCVEKFKVAYMARIGQIFPEECRRMNEDMQEKAAAKAAGGKE